ncbi:MAG: hypothetical protein ACFE0Q_21295 [Anaerolineae bacterium]
MTRQLSFIILTVCTMLIPLGVVSALLAWRFDATLFDHAPFWSDELYHWHQSVSFAEVGFNNGYYSLNENTPPADFSHYYAWGAWAYVLYGGLGSLFGFPLYALPIIHSVMLMGAIGVYVFSTRPDWQRFGLLGAVLASFIPLLLYLPSSMLEGLHLSIVLVLAGGFYRTLTQRITSYELIGLVLVAMLGGLVRPTHALFIPPLLALAVWQRTARTTIIAGIQALPPVLISALGYYVSSAPFPFSRSLLFYGDDALVIKLERFGAYLQQSLIWLTEGAGVVMAQRYQIALLLGLLMIWGAVQWWRERQGALSETDAGWRWEWALHLYNLLGFYTATILFHETLGGHDYRVMAPHLLFSLLVLVAMRRRVLVLALVAFTLLWLPAMWEEYNGKAPNFDGTVAQQFADWRSIMGDDLRYDPSASSAWCNTVMTSAFYVLDAAGTPGMLLSIDAGMGLSWTTDWVFPDLDLAVPSIYTTPQTFKARYLILTNADYRNWGNQLNLERIERAPEGALYRNLEAECSS